MSDAPGTLAGRRELPAPWAGAWALVAAALAAVPFDLVGLYWYLACVGGPSLIRRHSSF